MSALTDLDAGAGQRQGRRHPAPPTITERENAMARKAKAESVANGDELVNVRTTFNPSEVIAVGAAELLDLKRQGLVIDEADDAPTSPSIDDETANNEGGE